MASRGLLLMRKHDKVEMRLINAKEHFEDVKAHIHFGTWFQEDGKDLVFPSPLDMTHSVSDHMKWFHSTLHFDRKYIRQLEAAGIPMICRVRCSERSVTLEPEALLLGHQLHIQIKIEYVG